MLSSLCSPEHQRLSLSASITQILRYLSLADFIHAELAAQLPFMPRHWCPLLITRLTLQLMLFMWLITCWHHVVKELFFFKHKRLHVLPQELYQKLTDYDIRYYMYELLKVIYLFIYLFTYCLKIRTLLCLIYMQTCRMTLFWRVKGRVHRICVFHASHSLSLLKAVRCILVVERHIDRPSCGLNSDLFRGKLVKHGFW